MSDKTTPNKNDQENPSASNIKSPKPKQSHVIRILAVPGSRLEDESIQKSDLKDFMRRKGYRVLSSEEDEPMIFREKFRRPRKLQRDWQMALEEFRRKKRSSSWEEKDSDQLVSSDGYRDALKKHIEEPTVNCRQEEIRHPKEICRR